MGTVGKWLVILGGLGALYLVVQNPNGFYAATSGVKNLVAGSEVSIITGGKSGLSNPSPS
jgi:hypothetical protein